MPRAGICKRTRLTDLKGKMENGKEDDRCCVLMAFGGINAFCQIERKLCSLLCVTGIKTHTIGKAIFSYGIRICNKDNQIHNFFPFC